MTVMYICIVIIILLVSINRYVLGAQVLLSRLLLGAYINGLGDKLTQESIDIRNPKNIKGKNIDIMPVFFSLSKIK